MCDPTFFTAHYGAVLQRLGQRHRVLSDGSIHTQRGQSEFFIANSAPFDPEFLRVDILAPMQTDAATAALAITRTRVPKATILGHHVDAVFARAEMILASADCLPDQQLLVSVLPRVFHQLMLALNAYYTELTLTEILQATRAQQRAQPDLWGN